MYGDEIETFVTRSNICNEVDGRCYNVVEKFNESEKASELLAELNLFSLRVMRHLRAKYLWNYNSNAEARGVVQFLLSNYNPDGIIENAPTGSVNTSYVDDKGREFGICLREKISGKNYFHDIHDLQFVVLHELSHMANVNYGHEKDFWEIFKFMLREAKEAGLHDPRDYSKEPMNYCSLNVTHNPYFDDTVRNI
jgi:hypothetical protein